MAPGRPLKVGVYLPSSERVVLWPERIAMVRAAESVGLDSNWVPDHLLHRRADGTRAPWEAWTSLAGLAAATSMILLGPLVAATSFHSPAMLAKMAATVDQISGGRLILGLGAGWNVTDYTAFGFPFDHRISRFEEAFTIIRTLLRDGAIDFRGRYYEIRDCELLPRPARAGGPPLVVGSAGERMLRITLPYVAGWNGWYDWFGNTPAGVVPLLERVDRVCREVGRDPLTVERTATLQVRLPGWIGIRSVTETTVGAISPIAGSPQQIADALRGFAQAGLDHVQLLLDPITEGSIEALGPVLELLDHG